MFTTPLTAPLTTPLATALTTPLATAFTTPLATALTTIADNHGCYLVYYLDYDLDLSKK